MLNGLDDKILTIKFAITIEQEVGNTSSGELDNSFIIIKPYVTSENK